MSVVQNTLIGRARQKIGGSVFSTWKGHNVLKSKPLTVANPKTPKQLARRSALTQITAIFRSLSGVINLGFKQQAVGMSEFNAFSSYNLKNSFTFGTPGEATIVHADILVAQGTITTATSDDISASAGGDNIVFDTFSQVLAPGQSLNDQLFVAVYNVTKGIWAVATTVGKLRSTETPIATCPTGFVTSGNSIDVYYFFYNSTTRKASDSIYINVTAGA